MSCVNAREAGHVARLASTAELPCDYQTWVDGQPPLVVPVSVQVRFATPWSATTTALLSFVMVNVLPEAEVASTRID